MALSGYFAAVTEMDRNIGRMLDWLEANGLRESTLIMFMADNGMSMGHHGIWGKGNGTYPPNMYDTAVKIPALASMPGSVPQDLVCDRLLSQYDVMPTLLGYTGVDNPVCRMDCRAATSRPCCAASRWAIALLCTCTTSTAPRA